MRAAFAGLLALWLAGAAGGAEEIHGELDQFAGNGIAIVWAIRKAPVEDQSQVIARVVPVDARWAAISIDGVDPFTRERRVVLPRTPLGSGVQTSALRGSFADLPHRQFHFYAASQTQPGLTVYFMGVPDTTPEFLADDVLAGHLEQAVARLKAAGGSKP